MEPKLFVDPSTSKVILLVGTIKGAFLISSDANREKWQVSGPHFPGRVVYAMAYDNRAGRQRLWASSTHFAFGPMLHSSDDFGRTWTNPESAPVKFPESAGQSVAQIWQIAPGGPLEPQKLYCGVEPAALFESNDAGATWSLVQGLFDHPHRPQWEPGGGGLCLHTIVVNPANPQSLLVAISTGGVYRTDDGGQTWTARNSGVTAGFMPNSYPEFGQCVHKVARSAQPDRLYLQNHGGLFRSDDGGDHWQDIANGVPSDFGFPMVTHPRDPDTAYVFPLETEMRVSPHGELRVYRTRDAGASWQPLGTGFPEELSYETVLRDGMATDTLDLAGLYLGTRSGKVYGSADEGDTWRQIADGLPAVTCVKTAVL